MGLGKGAVMAGGADRSGRRNVLIISRIVQDGPGQDGCRQRIGINGNCGRTDVTARAVFQRVGTAGQPDFAEVVDAAAESIDDDAVFAIAVLI